MVIHIRIKPVEEHSGCGIRSRSEFPSEVPFIASCGTMPALVYFDGSRVAPQ
jgi:hypothetical protein